MPPSAQRLTHRSSMPRRERGLILFVALIVLVAMTLSGLAMMRGSSTGLLIAGNLAFRQASVSVADYGGEAARAWLLQRGMAALESDASGSGYYSSQGSFTEFSYASHNWSSNSQTVTPAPDAATTVRWVVHRMCALPNSSITASGQNCVLVQTSASTGSSKGVLSSAQRTLTAQSVLYRVTTRIDGPRNTVAYTQLVIY